MTRYAFVVFWSDEDGAWVADAPDLRSCSAYGSTLSRSCASPSGPGSKRRERMVSPSRNRVSRRSTHTKRPRLAAGPFVRLGTRSDLLLRRRRRSRRARRRVGVRRGRGAGRGVRARGVVGHAVAEGRRVLQLVLAEFDDAVVRIAAVHVGAVG